MEKIIASHVRSCLDFFRTTIGALESSTESPVKIFFLRDIRDEQSRFKVWSGNIGAHRTGMSSLDYRLRDSSHIRKQVIRLLGDLSSLLEDANAIIVGDEVPWDNIPGDQGLSSGREPREEDDPHTELGQISGDVRDVVNCLLRLSVTVRNPAPHDRFVQSATTDTSHYEPFDIEHVRSKFSAIEPGLADRLGKAISRRRQYFKYREAHHAKLSHGLDEHHLPDKDDPLHTIASSLPEHLKDKLGLEYMGQYAPLADDRSDTGVSLTSYATSISNSEQRRVPSLPEEASKGPFQCPFCYMIIEAKDRSSWKRHVFGDLRPYICLIGDCETPDKEFSQRHGWMSHMKQNHWKEYKCPFGCRFVFRSLSKCQGHVAQCHSGVGASVDKDVLEMLSAQPLDMSGGIICPICSETLISMRQYQRHVGRHQEQLALFALPSLDSEDESGHSEEEHSDASPVHSKGERGERDSAPEGEQEAKENEQVRRKSHDLTSTGSGPSVSTVERDAPVEKPRTFPPTRAPSSRQNEYFIPRDGIDREVITNDITHYLGRDALVRPGTYKDPNTKHNIHGYFITSYRNLTTEMIDDLKAHSARWEHERRARATRHAHSSTYYHNSETYGHSRGLFESMGAGAHGPPRPNPLAPTDPRSRSEANFEDSMGTAYAVNLQKWQEAGTKVFGMPVSTRAPTVERPAGRHRPYREG